MQRSLLLLLTILATAVQGVLAQQGQQGTGQEQVPGAAPLAPVQGGWSPDQQQISNSFWLDVANSRPGDANAHFNTFNSTRNANLATFDGHMPRTEQEKLQAIADDLDEIAPNSFEAHLANFHVAFPARSSFAELALAAKAAPERVELIGPRISEALLNGDAQAQRTWGKALLERGGVSPALLDVGSDILASAAPNAVLFTSGEMDTYPLVALQQGRGQRTDVFVVDQRMLAEPAYRQQVWRALGAANAPPGDGPQFVERLAESTKRPVELAPGLPRAWAAKLKDALYPTGMVLRYSTVPVDNIPLLEKQWAAMKKNPAGGPLARNYLYCGSVLLAHYRATENEMKVAVTEQELRRMAEAMGALPQLYKAGVLKH